VVKVQHQLYQIHEEEQEQDLKNEEILQLIQPKIYLQKINDF
jgi:hypothetical protein